MKETQKIKKKGREKNLEMLMDMIRQNTILLDYIERNYRTDMARMELLERILLKIGKEKAEDVKREIYLYGSLVKGRDFMARQIFLWLLGILEEKK